MNSGCSTVTQRSTTGCRLHGMLLHGILVVAAGNGAGRARVNPRRCDVGRPQQELHRGAGAVLLLKGCSIRRLCAVWGMSADSSGCWEGCGSGAGAGDKQVQQQAVPPTREARVHCSIINIISSSCSNHRRQLCGSQC